MITPLTHRLAVDNFWPTKWVGKVTLALLVGRNEPDVVVEDPKEEVVGLKGT